MGSEKKKKNKLSINQKSDKLLFLSRIFLKFFNFNILLGFVMILCAVPTVNSAPSQIHKRMTSDQVRQVFGSTHEDLPPYEIVNVEVSNRKKRDTPDSIPVRIRRFNNNDINLLLEPTDGILAGENTPVTKATVINSAVHYWDDATIMREVGRILQVSNTSSLITLSQNGQRRYVLNGHIEGENLVIRSLPEELGDHVVFELQNKTPKLDHPTYQFNPTMQRSTLKKNKRATPSIIYPEVMLIVDSSAYRYHGSCGVCVVRYLLATWNSVDLRFRKITAPRVRINIARIIIATEPEGTPYIHTNRINNTVMADSAIWDASVHFYGRQESFPLSSFDAIMITTRYKLMYNGGVVGLANLGGACTTYPFHNTTKRSAIVGDYLYLNYGLAIAHEFGHQLGARHPEDVKNCLAVNDLMSVRSDQLQSSDWDLLSCSVKQISEFTSSAAAQCLTNKPNTKGKILPRMLIGGYMSVDEQCKKRGMLRACRQTEPIEGACRFILCTNNTRGDECSGRNVFAAEEGTPCDDGKKICLQGRCVDRLLKKSMKNMSRNAARQPGKL